MSLVYKPVTFLGMVEYGTLGIIIFGGLNSIFNPYGKQLMIAVIREFKQKR
jgi:hypothetical protein